MKLDLIPLTTLYTSTSICSPTSTYQSFPPNSTINIPNATNWWITIKSSLKMVVTPRLCKEGAREAPNHQGKSWTKETGKSKTQAIRRGRLLLSSWLSRCCSRWQGWGQRSQRGCWMAHRWGSRECCSPRGGQGCWKGLRRRGCWSRKGEQGC